LAKLTSSAFLISKQKHRRFLDTILNSVIFIQTFGGTFNGSRLEEGERAYCK
jgi:hypothetical protein